MRFLVSHTLADLGVTALLSCLDDVGVDLPPVEEERYSGDDDEDAGRDRVEAEQRGLAGDEAREAVRHEDQGRNDGENCHDRATRSLEGRMVVGLLLQWEPSAEQERIAEQADEGEQAQQVLNGGSPNEDESEAGLPKHRNDRRVILGVNLAPGTPPVAFLSSLHLAACLEHDERGERAGYDDNGKNSSDVASHGAKARNVGEGLSDGSIGSCEGGDINQTNGSGGKAGVEQRYNENAADKSNGQVLLGVLDFAAHGDGGLHAVVAPGGGSNASNKSGYGACSRALNSRGREVGTIDEEQTNKNQDQERCDLNGSNERLPLGACVLVAHVQPGEEDDQDAANNVNRKIGPASEVGKIVGKRKSHRGDADGVSCPPARPDEEHCHEWPAGLTEVNELSAVLRICCGILSINKVLRNHNETTDEERQDGKEWRSGGCGYTSDGGEDAGTDGGSDAECDGGAKTKVAFKLAFLRRRRCRSIGHVLPFPYNVWFCLRGAPRTWSPAWNTCSSGTKTNETEDYSNGLKHH